MKLQVVGDFARAVLLCDTVSVKLTYCYSKIQFFDWTSVIYDIFSVNKYSSKFSFCMIYSVAFITQFLEIVYI